jgi:predicted nucleic acid-binding protein
MPVCFLDSSALVKCYVAEAGSLWTRSILDDENNVVYVASLSRVETISALTRRFRRRDISQREFDVACEQFRLDLTTQFERVGLTDPMIEEAASLAQTHGLRAYDAVQLAAALDTSRIVSQVELTELMLVSADIELNAAAAAEGLQVEDPNSH